MAIRVQYVEKKEVEHIFTITLNKKDMIDLLSGLTCIPSKASVEFFVQDDKGQKLNIDQDHPVVVDIAIRKYDEVIGEEELNNTFFYKFTDVE